MLMISYVNLVIDLVAVLMLELGLRGVEKLSFYLITVFLFLMLSVIYNMVVIARDN